MNLSIIKCYYNNIIMLVSLVNNANLIKNKHV